jgi:hypothetical protein
MLAGSGTGSLFPDETTMTRSAGRASFPRMIDRFLRQRVAEVLPPRELERLHVYLRSLISNRQLPPRCGGRPNWAEIAQECGVTVESLERASGILGPGIDAIVRFVGSRPAKRKENRKWGAERNRKIRPDSRQHRSVSKPTKPKPLIAPEVPQKHVPKQTIPAADPASQAPRRKRGMKPKPIVEFPDSGNVSSEVAFSIRG